MFYRYISTFHIIIFSLVSVDSGTSSLSNLPEIRLILLGVTGSGKSATGNTVLGQYSFESKFQSASVTKHCEKKSATRFGRNIIVVDTPGIFDTETPNIDIQNEIGKCMGIALPGFHAFVLVLNASIRHTEESRKSFEHFLKYFGDEVYKYFYVVFTRKEELDKNNILLVEYIENSPPSLRDFLRKIDGRVFAFNNTLVGEEQEEQVSELISSIVENVKRNGNKCYTHAMYEDAEKTLKKKEAEIERKINEEKERERKIIEKKCAQRFEKEIEQLRNQFDGEKRQNDEYVSSLIRYQNEMRKTISEYKEENEKLDKHLASSLNYKLQTERDNHLRIRNEMEEKIKKVSNEMQTSKKETDELRRKFAEQVKISKIQERQREEREERIRNDMEVRRKQEIRNLEKSYQDKFEKAKQQIRKEHEGNCNIQ